MDFLGQLHEAAAGLKRLWRTGWVERGVPRPESVAGHSLSVALLVLFEAERRRDAGEDFDVLAALRMALLHDLPEWRTGDLSPRQRRERFGDDEAAGRAAQREAEAAALAALTAEAPLALGARWRESWRRYREGEGPEARLVRDADRLDCVLQALDYMARGEGERLAEFGRLVDEIEDEGLRTYARARWSGRVAK